MQVSSLGTAIAASAIMLAASGGLHGQDYPTKPIRIITLTPGGGSDTTSRIVAQGISGPLGQPIVVENRTSVTAPEAVAKAPPDGHTLLIAGGSFLAGPLLQKTPFELGDFAPITMIDRATNMLAVHNSLPVKSVKELISFAKSRPGQLNFGSTGVGAGSHLAGELLNSMAGVKMVHVPFKGTARALASLAGGEIEVLVIDASAVAPMVKTGRLKALAVTSPQPSALYPNLPTVAQTLPGYQSVGMAIMFAPAKTPDVILTRLNQEVVRFVSRPETKEKLLNSGTEAVGSSQVEFATFVKAEVARLAKVIKEANIRLD